MKGETSRVSLLRTPLGYLEWLTLGTGGLMLVALVLAGPHLEQTHGSELGLAICLIVVFAAARLSIGASARSAALMRLPGYLLWVWFFHQSAGTLIAGLDLPRYEVELNAIDLAVLGEPITVALEAVHHPWLTEITQFTYNLYYFLVLSVPVVLALKGQRQAFDHSATLLLTIHGITVLGTLAFPAIWPALMGQDPSVAGLVTYTFPLEGIQLTETLRQMTATSTPHVYDCFPSGHTAMTLGTVIIAFRYLPRFLWALVPAGLIIVFGTVYLRYHYGIDIVAGALVALCAAALVQRYGRVRTTVDE